MQLPQFMTPEEFKKAYFGTAKRPSTSSIRRWLINGDLPGRRFGQSLFVDIVAFEANGNCLVEKILRHEPRAT